jgi:UDP-sugar transporter A1/2/3
MSARGGLGWSAIIAIQYGIQPMLAKSCITPGTPVSSLVLGQELTKIVVIVALLTLDGSGKEVLQEWRPLQSLLTAGAPSATYVVQNFCVQVAYQNLDGVVFNVLNQTKVLFTALFAFLIVGRTQSRMQCVALLMVTLAGVLISMPDEKSTGAEHGELYYTGIVCVLVASALSGFGSGVTEWALRRAARPSLVLSLELAVLGCLMVGASLLLGLNNDVEVWRSEGLFARWTPLTFVPTLTQGCSGLVVGILTKVAGGVRKVLATICGLLLTCLIQQVTYGNLKPSVLVAVPLVAGGVFLHVRYPAAKPAEKKS